MPILPREIDLYPPNLFDTDFVADDTTWWAIYTLSRREKDLMRRLKAMEIPFYCPLIQKKNRSPSGRVRHSYVPLFSGYVFAQGDRECRQQMLTTNCISQTIKVEDSASLLHDLRQINLLVDANAPMTIESKIQPRQRVRVLNGPFKGVEGTVMSRRGEEHLIVSVEFLQQGASVEIGDFQVEPI
jgi:transcription antitermination factor NusG